MKGTLKLRTASLAAAAVMAAGLFAALPAAAETSTPETAQEDSGVPYDVANGLENSFRYKDGVPIYDDSVPAIEWEDIVQQDAATYSSNGIATCSVTYNGFDVSYHQGTVDWDAVKNSGIDFVMIRCGIGSEYDGVGENKQDDAQWYRNVSECERLGIPYGVYLYSYAENTDMAASEARHTLSLLSGHNPTLPVFLDIEHTRDGNPIASNSTYGDIAQTWCNMVSNAGYRVGIYSYYYFFQNYLTDSRFSNSGWYKWMADYRSGVSYDGSSCNMWQYSNKGTVPGVNANVDLNYWFGEYPGNNNNYTGWRSENGRDYWYENGVKQGTTGRGKEIYDSGSNAWYWLDANQGGAKAVNKDVYQESNGGKWVRYDANGHMIKGWDTNDDGTYYFDLVTGAMTKGDATIDGLPCSFDTVTGIGLNCAWKHINGKDYWYEGGKRQGYDPNNAAYRGKEIYDPASNGWYWLDNVQQGAKAVSKDVYQESSGGKWVRYDANGHMVKGEDCQNGKWYYFEPVTGAMIKGPWTLPDGRKVYYDPKTGIMQYGSVAVNNQLYYFDPVYGKMTSGTPGNFWYTIDGKSYWYENWVRQGWQPSNANYRGKEIYDPASGAWYWLDSVQQGAKAVSKEVYQDSNGGKWVRYDANGAMIKGWYAQDGKRWYYDLNTGAMYKGWSTIDGQTYHFDETTGVLIQ